MAAWVARIDAIVPSGTLVVASVSYFDATDTAFADVLYTQQFSFAYTAANGDMRDTIVGAGVNARNARDRATSLAQAFPPGSTTIPVP